jgi:hypothetical protein
MVLEWFTFGPDNLGCSFGRCSDTLQLATLIRFTIPFFNPGISSLVPLPNNEDAVAQLDCPRLAAVNATAVHSESLSALSHEGLGLDRPLIIAGRYLGLNKSETVLGHCLDGLAV